MIGPEPIPISVLKAKLAVVEACFHLTASGNKREYLAALQDALMDLRTETIRELTHEAVKPCPECERVRMERNEYNQVRP